MLVQWGAGPRASQALIVAAMARAVLHGRTAASVEDVKALAKPILRHRVVTNVHMESEGMSAAAVVGRLVGGMRQRGLRANAASLASKRS